VNRPPKRPTIALALIVTGLIAATLIWQGQTDPSAH